MSPESGHPNPSALLDAVRASLATGGERIVLAVSGGLDSMVLLDAAVRVARDRLVAVATFDHRSGPHARAASALVHDEAGARGLRVIAGTATRPETAEAGWRAARWGFLNQVVRDARASIATAHTLDDQVETVCMRVLRGAGARGLAGLYAASPILRPLLSVRRADIAAYAAAAGVRHLEDPTNASPRFLRNRVRRDLLPAIARTRPGFARELLDIAHRAADVRHALDGVAEGMTHRAGRHGVSVRLEPLSGLDARELAALAPALAARAGTVLDHRGTTRLSQFILKSRVGARVQLSGGSEAVRTSGTVVIRRTLPALGIDAELPLDDEATVGNWRFRRVVRAGSGDAWAAALPADRALTVRRWRAGDRMCAVGSPSARRVKRFFSDAGIPGPDRAGWPVVLADGEIVWIPGVRRSDAATDRSGRPVLRYRCERNDS